MNNRIEGLWWKAQMGYNDQRCDPEVVAKFAELLVREHLGIWDLMDNGNDVEGYINMEDYPKAIINHFGLRKINDGEIE